MIHPDYQEIARRFRHCSQWTDEVPLRFEHEQVDLFSLEQVSRSSEILLGHSSYRCEEHGLAFDAEPTTEHPADCEIDANLRFRYLMVRDSASPDRRRRFHRCVIQLHGLNERSFTKYVPWAYPIWKELGIPVIMFPSSFHINRVNPNWMFDQHDNFERRLDLPGNQNVHRFNAVMSDRLGTHPERLFWGAIQTYWDIIDLVRGVRADKHPHLAPDCEFDFFGFSAGGYVSLSLLLDNRDNLFANSRGILFATCAAMRDTNFCSHLIVDQNAEISLMNLYVKHKERLASARLKHWMEEHGEGRWFNCFCGLRPDRSYFEPRLKEYASRLLGITNSSDMVFPPGAMMNALQGVHRSTGVRVEELDLGIHENPFAFPDYDQRDRSMITKFLDLEMFGAQYQQFVDLILHHLS